MEEQIHPPPTPEVDPNIEELMRLVESQRNEARDAEEADRLANQEAPQKPVQRLSDLLDELDAGNDDAMVEIAYIIRSRKAGITKEDWMRLNLQNRVVYFLTRTGGPRKYGELEANTWKRWDMARHHLFRTKGETYERGVAPRDFIKAMEDEEATAPGMPPKQWKMPKNLRPRSQQQHHRSPKLADLGREGAPPSYTPVPSGPVLRNRCKDWGMSLTPRSDSCQWPLFGHRVWNSEAANEYFETSAYVEPPPVPGTVFFTKEEILLQQANARRFWKPPRTTPNPTQLAQESVIPCRQARPPGNTEQTYEYLHSHDFRGANGRKVLRKEAELSISEQRKKELTARAKPHPQDLRLGRVPMWTVPPPGGVRHHVSTASELSSNYMRGGETQENLRQTIESSLLADRSDLQKSVKANRDRWKAEVETKKLLGHAIAATPMLKVRHANRQLQGPAPLRPMLDTPNNIFDTIGQHFN